MRTNPRDPKRSPQTPQKVVARGPLSSILTLASIAMATLSPFSSQALTCADVFSGTPAQLHSALEPYSVTLNDPMIQRATELSLYPDFKYLVDLVPLTLSSKERAEIQSMTQKIRQEKGEEAAIRFHIDRNYKWGSELLPAPRELVKARWALSPSSRHKATFGYIEVTWETLAKVTPQETRSTLLPLPHPVLIPGSRFQEAYYWDSYFALHALVGSGRGQLVRGQIENFVHMINTYGLVPNGNREYYLSRSQPPLLSRMIRDYLSLTHGEKIATQDLGWLRTKILPALIKDYRQFWMNPRTRYDARTGLNRHYDALNTPRPERHSKDKENLLGITPRDVRAEAESGKDFTIAFEGEATQFASVLLNSVMYGVEKDIAYLLTAVGRVKEAKDYERLAAHRKSAMETLMKDPETGLYFDYHLGRRERISILTADAFAPFWVGLDSSPTARASAREALARLEKAGGIVSSEVTSGKQWDAPYTWAPHIFFAVEGLRRIGLESDAHRIGENWVNMIDRVHDRMGTILEKYDALRAEAPIETGEKYETQQGFLWTNGVYTWIVRDILGEKPIPLISH